MADDALNPSASARLSALEQELRALRAELKGEFSRLEQQATAERQRRVREEPRARVREEARGRRPVEAGVTDEEAPRYQRGTRVIEQQTKATRELEQAQRAANAEVRRGRSILPPGQFGGQRPTLVPGPPGGPVAPRGRPTEGYAAVRQAEAQATVREAAALGTLDQALARDVSTRGVAMQQLRRHGALTSEFFAALGRGEVTLAELRYQMGITIAKFSGWIAAGAAVFGVVDTVRELGRGAIDASAGVNQLQRYVQGVNTDRAREQLLSLSREFNVPIAEAANAFAQMGQIFHNQDDAFQGARAALFGVKTGQLAVGDSTRFLIGIMNGLQIPASQAELTYDRLNQAQNRFGVSIRDAAAGVAKAGGAWHAAGGQYAYLLSLITTGQRVTGRSGENIGTALQRSAEGIFRRPINRQILRDFGIDTAQSVDQIYEQAFRLVESKKVTGRRITKLATGLSTPQYAPIISAALQNADLFREVQHQLAPGQARGSASRELRTQLQSVREELSKVPNTLQRIGGELGRGPYLAPLAEMLKLLTTALSTTEDLLRAFNSLPAPIKDAVVWGGELVLLMRLMRRFNVGERFGVLGGGPGRAGVRASAADRAATLTTAADRAYIDAANAREQQRIAARQVVLADERYGTESDAAAAAREAEKRSATAVVEAELRYAATVDELALAREAQRIAVTAMRAGATAEEAAALSGTPYVAPGARGSTAAASAEATVRAEREAEAAVAGRRGFTDANSSRIGRAADRALTGVYVGAQRLEGAFGRAGAGALGMAGRFAASLGPLDAFFAAIIAIPLLVEAAKSAAEKDTRERERFAREPRTERERGTRLREGLAAQRRVDRGETRGSWLLELARGAGYESPDVQAARDADTLLTTLQYQNRYIAQRNAGRGPLANRPIPNLSTAQIRHHAGLVAQRFREHQITLEEANRQLDLSIKDVNQSTGTRAQKVLARVDLKRLKASLDNSRHNLREMLDALDLKDFQKAMQDDLTAVQVYDQQFGRIRGPRLKEIGVGYRTALRRFQRAPTIDNANRLDAARKALDGVGQQITQDLEDSLKYATTPAQQQRAIDRALHEARRLPRGRQRSHLIRDILDRAPGLITQALEDQLKYAETAVESQRAIDTALARARALPPSMKRSHLIRDIQNRDYEQYRTNVEASYALAEARTSSEAEANALELRKVNLLIARARADHADQATLAGLYLQRRQVEAQAAQDAINISNLRSQLSHAGIPSYDAVGQAEGAHADALNNLREILAHRSALGKDFLAMYLQAQINVRQTAQAVQEAARQQAVDLQNSIYELEASRTENPVKLARIAEQRDRYAIRMARTPTERNLALAQYNRDKRATRDAIAQERLDEIEFEASIGKLTSNQEIVALKNLLHTVKMSKEARRRLRTQIYQLQHANDGNLAEIGVGNIKLPTVYEIRRAMRDGGRTLTHHVSVQQNNRINVQVAKGADVDAIFDALERNAGTTVQAAGRSSGVM